MLQENLQNWSKHCESNDLTHAPTWYRDQQQTAFEQLLQAGLPTRRVEAHKYTPIRFLDEQAVIPARNTLSQAQAATQIKPYLIPHSQRLVFIDGYLDPQLSTPTQIDELILLDLKTALANPALMALLEQHFINQAQQSPRNLIAAALASNGVILCCPKPNTVIETPVQLFFISSGQHSQMCLHPWQNLYALGNSGQAEVIEYWFHADGNQDANYAQCAQTQINLSTGASLKRTHCTNESTQATHWSTTQTSLAAHAQFEEYSIALSGQLVRKESHVHFNGDHAQAKFSGAFCAQSKEHVDHHLQIHHHVPHCRSEQFFRGVLHDQAKGVFTGRVEANQAAHHTIAKQMNNNILLSKSAEMNTQPQLEINTEEIECTHGATVGQLDQDTLFYCQSRGISQEQAMLLLLDGFFHAPLEALAKRSEFEPLLKLSQTKLQQLSSLRG